VKGAVARARIMNSRDSLTDLLLVLNDKSPRFTMPVRGHAKTLLRRRKVLFLAGSMELTMRTRLSAGEDGANPSQWGSAALTIEPKLIEKAAGKTPTLTNGVDEDCRECMR
jgi:hypothetical protein